MNVTLSPDTNQHCNGRLLACLLTNLMPLIEVEQWILFIQIQNQNSDCYIYPTNRPTNRPIYRPILWTKMYDKIINGHIIWWLSWSIVATATAGTAYSCCLIHLQPEDVWPVIRWPTIQIFLTSAVTTTTDDDENNSVDVIIHGNENGRKEKYKNRWKLYKGNNIITT